MEDFLYLDILITGNPFSAAGSLVDCLSEGGDLSRVGGIAYRNESGVEISDAIEAPVELDDLPMPAYDLLDSFEDYYIIDPLMKQYALVYRGQGCPFSCRFCCVAETAYSCKSVDYTMEELKLLKDMGDVKYFCFHDEVFTLNREDTIELCMRMIDEDLGIKWFCDSRVDTVDKEMLKIMKRAGCIGVSYGVESGSQKVLDSMNKGSTVEEAKKALIWTQEAHIPLKINLILGFIGEDEWTLKETEDLVRGTLAGIVKIAGAGVLKGTEFARIAVEKGWVKEQRRSYRLSDYPFHPSTGQEIEAQRKRIIRMLHHDPTWWAISLGVMLRNPELLLGILGARIRRLGKPRLGYGLDGLEGL